MRTNVKIEKNIPIQKSGTRTPKNKYSLLAKKMKVTESILCPLKNTPAASAILRKRGFKVVIRMQPDGKNYRIWALKKVTTRAKR